MTHNKINGAPVVPLAPADSRVNRKAAVAAAEKAAARMRLREFASRQRATRKAAGYSAEEAARRLGVSTATLTRYERGETDSFVMMYMYDMWLESIGVVYV